MSTRLQMEDVKQRGVAGVLPEFGAIFMSNSATKREFFKRKFFGLPSSYAYFVNHVKAGMILFLFEFEKRELHGVFQASYDGAMNIVPNSLSASGKQLPAQVKFTQLWSCTPLPENEFRDAIRENYFSARKFNFGLSEYQVVQLLSLFSLRKKKDWAPEKQLTSSELAKQSGSPMTKVRRVVHSDMFLMGNQVTVEHGVDSKRDPVLSTMHPGGSLCNDGKEIDDDRSEIHQPKGYENKMDGKMVPGISVEYFGDSSAKVRGDLDGSRLATSNGTRSKRNMDVVLRPVKSVGNSLGDFRNFSDVRFTRRGSYENEQVVSMGYSLGDLREASDDVRFARSGRLKNEHYEDNVAVPATSMKCPSFYHTKLNSSSYSSKHVLNADSCAQDPSSLSSTFIRRMESCKSKSSYPTTYGDAIITRTHPCDPDVPGINYSCSSSLDINQYSRSLQCAPDSSIAVNVLSSFGNQSPPSYLESGNTSICHDVHLGSSNHSWLPHLNQYEYYSKASLSCPASGENLTVESSENEGYDGISFPMPSQSGNNGRISEPLPFCSFGSRYPYYTVASADKPHHKVPDFENAVEFTTDFPAFDEGQFLLGGHCSVQPRSTDYHKRTLSSPVYQNSESMDVDCQKKRGGVFSRLTLAPKVYKREINIPSGNNYHSVDNSVNEVMSTLYHSRYPWLKVSCKSLIKRDSGENVRKKKHMTISSKSLKDPSAISKEMNIKSIPAGEKNIIQQAEGTPFVDFKRRSIVKKTLPEGRTENCSETAEDTSIGQRKRKKLIRPDFGKNYSSEDKGMDGDVPHNLKRPLLESSVGTEKVSLTHINENKISEYVKLLPGMSQTDHGGKHTVNTGRGSSFVQIGAEGGAPENLQRPSLEASKVSVSHVNEGKISEYVKLPHGMSQTDQEDKQTVDIENSSLEKISMDGDAPEKLQRPFPESSIGKRDTEDFNASVSHVHVSKMHQRDELMDVLCETSHEVKSISMKRHLNLEEVKVKRFGENADNDRKESYERVNSRNVACRESCTKVEGFSTKYPSQDELCQGDNSASHFIVQDLSPKVIEAAGSELLH
ncbi:hypothetical protein SLEP1_g6357 [Rubroshorea leprosula]|nr:hypothetical protein SLEP1_g6357 [Rubroshorea leprosula]